MSHWLVPFGFLLLFSSSISAEEQIKDGFVEAKTRLGTIRGKVDLSEPNHIPFASFRAIPYAKPPIGELRFK